MNNERGGMPRLLGRPDVIADYLARKEKVIKQFKTKQPITPTDNSLDDPVYILIRTSNRPQYFSNLMQSIKSQTHKNIITIVHSDDPRDDYVTGDIVIRGPVYHPNMGTGPYNLYNNRLLAAIPRGPGWYHFIDDDDIYMDDKVIESLVKNARNDCVNVGRVTRWAGTVWPKNWGLQRSFQTECFFLPTSFRKDGKWWANKGGDHYYSRQLTEKYPIHWMSSVMICRAQEGKNHGRRIDVGKKAPERGEVEFEKATVLMIRETQNPRIPEMREMEYKKAVELETKKLGVITYGSVTVEDNRHERTTEADKKSTGPKAKREKSKKEKELEREKNITDTREQGDSGPSADGDNNDNGTETSII